MLVRLIVRRIATPRRLLGRGGGRRGAKLALILLHEGVVLDRAKRGRWCILTGRVRGRLRAGEDLVLRLCGLDLRHRPLGIGAARGLLRRRG